MKEQIIINGENVDLFDGKTLSFEVSSNLMKKVDAMSTGYSYTYAIPNSLNNRRILGDLLRIGRDGNKVRRYLSAEYYRNGIRIFSGECYVNECVETEISVYFKFGLNKALQQIKDDGVKLSSLWNDNDNDFVAHKGTTGIDEIESLCVTYPCTKSDWLLYDDRNTRPIAPVIPLYNRISDDEPELVVGATYHSIDVNRTILAQITKRYGVTFEGLVDADVYLQYKPNYKRYSYFTIHSTGYKVDKGPTFIGAKTVDCIMSNFTSDTTTVTSENDYEIRKDGKLYDFNITSTFFETYSEFEIDSVSIKFNADIDGYLYYCSTAGLVLHSLGHYTANTDFETSFSPKDNGWAYVCQELSTPMVLLNTFTEKTTATATIDVTINGHFNGKASSQNTGLFNIFDTLPDTSVTQFLTDYAFVTDAKYPINTMQGGNTIKFVSLDNLIGNGSVDWSDKLITDDLKVYHTIDDTARVNWLCWADDDSEILYDTDHPFCKGVITDDETLEKETESFKGSIGYAIPHAGDNSSWFVCDREGEDKTPAPRLMAIVDDFYMNSDGTNYAQTTQADNVIRPNSWQTGTTTTLANVLKKPVRIECRLMLSAVDLSNLDFAKMVYLRQFGAFFFIDKLTVDDDTTKAVLIKLK